MVLNLSMKNFSYVYLFVSPFCVFIVPAFIFYFVSLADLGFISYSFIVSINSID